MRIEARLSWRLASVLVDPTGAIRAVVQRPAVGAIALVLFAAVAALGAACLPRQLSLLGQALAPTGDAMLDFHYEAMRGGLARIVLVDRLIPSPLLVIAAALVVSIGEPVLALARDRRAALWTVVLLGLAPLLVQQLGELAVTYLAAVTPDPTPGHAVSLPHRFSTGPVLLWRGETPAPAWLEIVDARVNLITLWCVALWTTGFRVLEGRRFAPWHVAVPLAGLAGAGVLTWILGPLARSALLGNP